MFGTLTAPHPPPPVAQALTTHPDKNKGEDEEFVRVKRAWEVLSDPDERKKYDAQLASRRVETVIDEHLDLNDLQSEEGYFTEDELDMNYTPPQPGRRLTCRYWHPCRCGGGSRSWRTSCTRTLTTWTCRASTARCTCESRRERVGGDEEEEATRRRRRGDEGGGAWRDGERRKIRARRRGRRLHLTSSNSANDEFKSWWSVERTIRTHSSAKFASSTAPPATAVDARSSCSVSYSRAAAEQRLLQRGDVLAVFVPPPNLPVADERVQGGDVRVVEPVELLARRRVDGGVDREPPRELGEVSQTRGEGKVLEEGVADVADTRGGTRAGTRLGTCIDVLNAPVRLTQGTGRVAAEQTPGDAHLTRQLTRAPPSPAMSCRRLARRRTADAAGPTPRVKTPRRSAPRSEARPSTSAWLGGRDVDRRRPRQRASNRRGSDTDTSEFEERRRFSRSESPTPPPPPPRQCG